MERPNRPLAYHAWMLRIWCDDTPTIYAHSAHASGRWRFSLEDPHSGERIGFATMQLLCDYLMAIASVQSSCEQSDNQPDTKG